MNIPYSRGPIPELVERYLNAHRIKWNPITVQGHKNTLMTFHRWLKIHGVKLENITQPKILKFLEHPSLQHPNRKPSPFTRRSNNGTVRHYLHWLIEQGHIDRNFQRLFPDQSVKSTGPKHPPPAMKFLELLGATLAPRTIEKYSVMLSHLYRFLDEQEIEIQKLDRQLVEGFLKYMKAIGLSTNNRRRIGFELRTYLRWLNEHGLFEQDADKLFRHVDFPKMTYYLPRPFPPAVDRKLQERFAETGDIHSRALLLMRWTGIRIGELVSLTYDCIKEDHSGTKFLKVELGKLKTERLVPINSKTADLIRSIQRQSLRSATEYRKGRPERLVFDPFARKHIINLLRLTLRETCRGLQVDGDVTTHRLRHSYATSLLNAGISLPALMRLLGHRNIAMTMRYVHVTQETVKREFFSAFERLEKNYFIGSSKRAETVSDSILEVPLSDLARAVRKDSQGRIMSAQRLSGILQRIRRLENELRDLKS